MVPDADITLSAEDRPIGGLGIFLIRQIMNEVRYERIEDRNVLTMEKKLQQQIPLNEEFNKEECCKNPHSKAYFLMVA